MHEEILAEKRGQEPEIHLILSLRGTRASFVVSIPPRMISSAVPWSFPCSIPLSIVEISLVPEYCLQVRVLRFESECCCWQGTYMQCGPIENGQIDVFDTPKKCIACVKRESHLFMIKLHREYHHRRRTPFKVYRALLHVLRVYAALMVLRGLPD